LKKNSKFIVFISVLTLLLVTLVACGNNDAGKQEDSLSTKTGVLVEVSQNIISVQAPDGTTYTFGVDANTAIEGSELLGNTVSVSFKGEYSSGIIAVSIRTITEVDHTGSSDKGSTDDPDALQPREPSSTDETIWYMTGTVKNITPSRLELLYEDGHTYIVTIDSNTKVDKDVAVGSTARVFHKGKMVDGMVATEIHFIPQEETIWYFTGTVKDLTSTSLQLLYEDGHTYSVVLDNKTKIDKKVVVGCTARVFHTGKMEDGMVATEVHFISDAEQQQSTPAPEDRLLSIQVTIVAISDTELQFSNDGVTITAKLDANTEYTILDDNATVSDIVAGRDIWLDYKGYIQDGMLVLGIELLPISP